MSNKVIPLRSRFRVGDLSYSPGFVDLGAVRSCCIGDIRPELEKKDPFPLSEAAKRKVELRILRDVARSGKVSITENSPTATSVSFVTTDPYDARHVYIYGFILFPEKALT